MYGAAEGTRNTSITQLAGYLLRHHVDPAVALVLLESWNEMNARQRWGSIAKLRQKSQQSAGGAIPQLPAPAPQTETARLRTTQDETEALRKHIANAGRDIVSDDLIVAPDSASARARPSEYGLIRIPTSHPNRDDMKQALNDFRKEYNTELFFKNLPQQPTSSAAAGGGGDVDEPDHDN